MVVKKIINNEPKPGDVSQYNFEEGYAENPPVYEDSIGLPEYNDKFQKKDLFTNCVGDEVNSAIIEKNLKFEGDPYIKIENLYISNTGVDGTVKSNRVAAWIFSQEAYGGDPTKDGYSTLKSKLWNDDNELKWKFFDSGFGSKGQGSDIGNITNLEGTPILSNFGVDSPAIILGDFDGSEMTTVEDVADAFKLNPLESGEGDTLPPTQTTIFNEQQYNPVYIVIYMRGHKKVAWPVNTDERKRRYDIFKINTDELFERKDDNFIGKVYQTNFSSATKTRTGDGGGGASAAAWRVTSLQISINTSAGVQNKFSEVADYQQVIPEILPKIKLSENTFNDDSWLGSTNPRTQLDNKQDPGADNASLRHPDFIPFTSFGFSQNNQLGNNYIDLQNYNTDFNSIIKASVPLNVTFNIDVKDFDGNSIPSSEDSDNDLGSGLRVYYYFVIDWDDKDDKFKTIDDWLDSKPTNTFDYLELQNQNLYKISRIAPDIEPFTGGNTEAPSNVYTTPGIKNIKFVIVSAWRGTLDLDDPDEDGFELGRWKLCTSRIYLDIPPNQYPDFGDVGGADYITLPWPYTTVIIGGVSEDSKYKKSIKNTLGGGRIGEFDIIDEKLLVNDLDNDEMGKNIETMDLEQVRYFNTGSYDMNTLLGVNPITDDGFRSYNYFLGTTLNDGETIEWLYPDLDVIYVPAGIISIVGDGTTAIYHNGIWVGSLQTLKAGNSYTFNLDRESIFWNYAGADTIPYWDGETPETTFPMESSVGQIFIGDNLDLDLKQSCKLELNTGELTGKSILDTSGNSNKGLLIGDYKVKKVKKGQSMRRDSFVKVPKKKSNTDGAL